MRGSLAVRLANKSEPIPWTGCWIFSGAETDTGYGQIRNGDKMIAAHRAAYIVAHGEVPDDMHVLHQCDVRSCVNPDHLFLGSHQDNMNDMKAKGRRVGSLVGERMGMAKLSDAAVVAIRKEYAGGGVRQVDLAEKHSVSQVLISKIVRRKAWTHI
jgi:hypothetical protein